MDFKESYLRTLRAEYAMDYFDENVLVDIVSDIEDDIYTLECLKDDLDMQFTGREQVEKNMKDYGLLE